MLGRAAYLVAFLALGIGCLTGCSRSDDPAARERAQQRWLELIQDRDKALCGIKNAKLLARCFKKGDVASNYTKILETGDAMKSPDCVRYQWSFVVEKPPKPDNTYFIVTVLVEGDPATILDVTGSYTVD